MFEYLLASSIGDENEAVSTDAASASLIDITSGNILQNYKNGGIAVRNSLNHSKNYVLIADKNAEILHMWPLNIEWPTQDFKFQLPQPAGVLAISPNGHYLAVSIGPKLFVWHLPSTQFIMHQEKHISPITCVKFSADNRFLVTTCETGVLVKYVIVPEKDCLPQGEIKPSYILKDHTDAIVDLYIGKFDDIPCVVTVSKDYFIRSYNLDTNEELFAFKTLHEASSVVTDDNSRNLFLGSTSGIIWKHTLLNHGRRYRNLFSTVVLDDDQNDVIPFSGHKQQVTCLDINKTNTLLVSVSDDGFVILWDMGTAHQLKVIEYKGRITSISFILTNKKFASDQERSTEKDQFLEVTILQ